MKARTLNLFEQGQDLPLFTGQPVTHHDEPARQPGPMDHYVQPDLVPSLRTTSQHTFYPERDSSGRLGGKRTLKPAGTPVRLVERQHNAPAYYTTDCLVESDGLYSWVHHSELDMGINPNEWPELYYIASDDPADALPL